MNANSALSEYPDLGTQLIADLLYVAPQLAMHNLVSHQARGDQSGVLHLTLSLLLANVGNVVRKTWTYLVRTCHQAPPGDD